MLQRGLIGTAGLLLALYFGSGYWAFHQLDQAVTSEDVKALDRLVDWDSVSDNLEDDLEDQFEAEEASVDDPMPDVTANLMGIFADLLIAPIVAFYASPDGLPYLLNTQVILDDPIEALEADFPDDESWYDRISLAIPTGPTQVTAWIAPVEETSGGSMKLILRFRDFRWQLTAVRLPLEDILE